MAILKDVRVRLRGEAMRKLNFDIHERDNYQCVVCGRYVPEDEKFHHEPCGAYKSDEMKKGVILCQPCHYQRHHGAQAAVIKETCTNYLADKYGSK